MSRPSFIRFVVPTNQNPVFRPSLPGACAFTPVGTSIRYQNPSVYNGILNSAPAFRIVVNTKSNLSKPPQSFKEDPSTVVATTNDSLSKSTSSEIVQTKLNTSKDTIETNACSNEVAPSAQSSSSARNTDRTSSLNDLNIERKPRKKKLKRICEEPSSVVHKRSKNLSDAETFTFISVWSDHYTELTTGGSRNAPIYSSMAVQLNSMFSNRNLTGQDVKPKIGNLVAEYRKKKREQGRTGASPCTWAYYDVIDKLIGERPYNDDSLLSDSMKLQEDLVDVTTEIEPDLNLTQVAQQVDDLGPTITDTDEIIPIDGNLENSTANPSEAVGVMKVDTPNKVGSVIKKPASSKKKKKKAADLKYDLLEQLLNKIDGANDVANQSEVKILSLLEKQTRLQEESVQNEREFLNVFKSIVNNPSARP